MQLMKYHKDEVVGMTVLTPQGWKWFERGEEVDPTLSICGERLIVGPHGLERIYEDDEY